MGITFPFGKTFYFIISFFTIHCKENYNNSQEKSPLSPLFLKKIPLFYAKYTPAVLTIQGSLLVVPLIVLVVTYIYEICVYLLVKQHAILYNIIK